MGNPIISRLKELSKEGEELYIKLCKVVAIDQDKRIMDCEPIDGSAKILDVRLTASATEYNTDQDFLCIYPRLQSIVAVGYLDSNEAVLCLASEIDKMELKIGESSVWIDKDKNEIILGDNHLTITKDDTKLNLGSTELTLSPNKCALKADKIEFNGGANMGAVNIIPLVAKLNALEIAFNTHFHNIIAPLPSTPVTPPMTPVVPTTKAELEDTKFTH